MVSSVQRETLPLSLWKHRKARCLASTLATTRSQVNEECRSQIEGNESKVRRCQRAPRENLVLDQTILGHTLPSHLMLYNPLCLLQCYCFLMLPSLYFRPQRVQSGSCSRLALPDRLLSRRDPRHHCICLEVWTGHFTSRTHWAIFLK